MGLCRGSVIMPVLTPARPSIIISPILGADNPSVIAIGHHVAVPGTIPKIWFVGIIASIRPPPWHTPGPIVWSLGVMPLTIIIIHISSVGVMLRGAWCGRCDGSNISGVGTVLFATSAVGGADRAPGVGSGIAGVGGVLFATWVGDGIAGVGAVLFATWVGDGIAGVGAVLFATSAVGGAGVGPEVGDGVASGMVAVCHTGLLETGSETAAPSFQVSADPFRRVQNVKSWRQLGSKEGGGTFQFLVACTRQNFLHGQWVSSTLDIKWTFNILRSSYIIENMLISCHGWDIKYLSL